MQAYYKNSRIRLEDTSYVPIRGQEVAGKGDTIFDAVCKLNKQLVIANVEVINTRPLSLLKNTKPRCVVYTLETHDVRSE